MKVIEHKLSDGLSRVEIHGLNEAQRVCCLAFRAVPTRDAGEMLDGIKASVKAAVWPYSTPNAVAARRKLARQILGA